MGNRTPRRERPPLDQSALQELALRYVGRFATTRAKLIAYLQRKLRERGWSDPAEADPVALAEHFAALGYIDDAGFARSRAVALGSRGYGKSRVVQALRVAGVAEADSSEAHAIADADAVESALRLARRKRIGPFAACEADPKARERALAAMVRAGHGFGLSRAIVDLPAGEDIPTADLLHIFGRSAD